MLKVSLWGVYCWRAIDLCLVLLGVRHCAALLNGGTSLSILLPTILVVVVAGWCFQASAYAAMLLFVPLLNGLNILGLEEPTAVTVFFFVFLGSELRMLFESDPRVGHSDRGQESGTLIDFFACTLGIVVSLATLREFGRHLLVLDLSDILVFQTFPFDSPFHFLNVSSIWLAGIKVFKVLGHSPFWRTGGSGALMVALTLEIAFFCLVQLAVGVPELRWGRLVCNAPFEDIHAFGSFAAALTVFWICKSVYMRGNVKIMCLRVLCLTLSVGMVIASWSRSAWLATLIMVTLVALSRMSLRNKLVLGVALALIVGVANVNDRIGWWENSRHQYLKRFSDLVRIEPIGRKDPGRVELFGRAMRMIYAEPVLGVGLGRFYAESMKFVNVESGRDPPLEPNFAHNAVLQISSEIGIPAGLLLISVVLCCGCWPTADRNVLLPWRFALWTYFMTQLTSNSLNIYASQQFLFWMLVGATSALVRPFLSSWVKG